MNSKDIIIELIEDVNYGGNGVIYVAKGFRGKKADTLISIIEGNFNSNCKDATIPSQIKCIEDYALSKLPLTVEKINMPTSCAMAPNFIKGKDAMNLIFPEKVTSIKESSYSGYYETFYAGKTEFDFAGDKLSDDHNKNNKNVTSIGKVNITLKSKEDTK